jgi:hypothetical protein
MPRPMTQPDGPHRTEQPAPQARERHEDLAMALPAWDLLPPAEFVRRRPVT